VQWAGLAGGKGGFGATLKSAGKGGKAVTNFGFCRDLNGRRLRHVNAEKRLRAWAQPGEVERRERLGTSYHEPRGESRVPGWHMAVPSWARLPRGELKAQERADRRAEWRKDKDLDAAREEREGKVADRERRARAYAEAGRRTEEAATRDVAAAVAAGVAREGAAAPRGVAASAVYSRALASGAAGAAAGAAAAAAAAAAANDEDDDEDDWMVDPEASPATAAASAALGDAEEGGDDWSDARPWLECAPGADDSAAVSHAAAGEDDRWAALAEATSAAAMASVWAPAAARRQGGGAWTSHFEVLVLSADCVVQAGWADCADGAFRCRPGEAEGAGDDAAGRSAAWDAARGLVWHRGVSAPSASSRGLVEGDVIGCVCRSSAEGTELQWLLNGEEAASMSLGPDCGWASVCPAVSVEQGGGVQVVLGASRLLPLAFPIAGVDAAGAALDEAPKRPRESLEPGASPGAKRGREGDV